mmetsp:Transcript_12017/g.28500  ORF Transcript_12017/g.28500 Transcript_12017/m.28500 type:complete len:811 (-) Transcript_12017:1323-3755(-)
MEMMPKTSITALMERLKTMIGKRPKTVLGATIFLGAIGYRRYKAEKLRTEDTKKKKVLVLPFHRMKIVEEKTSPIRSSLQQLLDAVENNNPATEKVIEMQADELVSLINEAARDPSIVSLYGIFGNGGSIATGGWAHLEEIRTALERFARTSSLSESQEIGLVDTKDSFTPRRKAMYAYSNTFGGPQSMRDYYLASAFEEIHLQPQGDLNLYGLHATNMFFRDFLKKYGITVHVWKHGDYKNMANVFTHTKYSKQHSENVLGILLPIQRQIRKAIYTSRHKQLKQYGNDFDKFWTMIESAGSFPADVAQQIGFVDHLPLINPLERLVKDNKKQKGFSSAATVKTGPEKENGPKSINSITTDNPEVESSEKALELGSKLEKRIYGSRRNTDHESSSVGDLWKLKTNVDNFTADSQITIDSYARQKAKARSADADDWKFFQSLKKAAQSNIVAKQLLSLVGYSAPYFNVEEKTYSKEKASGLEEKIAVIKINGAIGEATARKAEKALQSVKQQQNVKCVVLRVDSPGGSINACESIYQEIRDIPQKVVVSFGNVSASGGYYISSCADKIFASSSTITGSIGVFMIRMDFKDLAKRYGITFDSLPTSVLSGSNDPFYPINKQMEENFANQADRSYHRFKSLVSIGRNFDMEAVEVVAKGRVWTGEQACKNGLVDELGGLDEAVAFAQQNYTSSGDAQVVQWPPKKSLWEFMTSRGQEEDNTSDVNDLDIPEVLHVPISCLLHMNNHLASVLGNHGSNGVNTKIFPHGNHSLLSLSIPFTSHVMLTMNENAAIQCMLDDAKFTAEIATLNDHIR